MPSIHEMAVVARAWLKEHGVYRYGLKKIADMSDREVLQKCHFWCEENRLNREFQQYERELLYAPSKDQKQEDFP